MAMNYDAMPTSKPGMSNIIPKGCYKAHIVKAEMKTPKNGGNDYFQAECDITDRDSGTKMGKFWVKLFESEKAFTQYQIKRFIDALKLNIKGEFELKDLTKMCPGKDLLIDICPEDAEEPKQSVVDISADSFYPIDRFQEEEKAMAEAEADAAAVFESQPDTTEPVLDTGNVPEEPQVLSDY